MRGAEGKKGGRMRVREERLYERGRGQGEVLASRGYKGGHGEEEKSPRKGTPVVMGEWGSGYSGRWGMDEGG